MGIIKEGRFPPAPGVEEKPDKKAPLKPKVTKTKPMVEHPDLISELNLEAGKWSDDYEESQEGEGARIPLHEQRRRTYERRVQEERQPDEREKLDPAVEKRKLLNEAKERYAKVFGKAFTDRKWYQRILGVNVEKFEEVKQAREAYQRALDEYIRAERENILTELKSGKISAQEAEMRSKNFAQFIKGDEIVSLAQRKQREAERQSEERGLIITKLSARWNEMMGKWRKLPWYVKVGASITAFMVGGAGAVAAVGIIRVLNGAVFGKAAQEYLQTWAEGWREDRKDALLRQVGKEVESKIGEAEDRVKRVFGILERDNDSLSNKLEKQAGGDIWRRLVGILAGVIAGSGMLAKAVGWGYEHLSGKPSVGAVVPEGSGKGALAPDIMETRPHGHVINEDENIWKVTRDIYMENPKGYQYDPSDPKIEKLFQSFQRQGILGRMGIDADNFSDLSPEEKIKIWAENRTANSVRGLAEIQGGRVRDLVHAGDTVVLKPDGTIVFDNASGIKAGYLDDIRARGGARGAVDTSQFDRQIEAARARGAAAETLGRQRVAELAAEAELADDQAVLGATSANARLWNMWMENGKIGGFRLSDKVSEIKDAIKGLSPDITSDQPLAATAAEIDQRKGVIGFTQEMFRRWPEQKGETMQNYLERMSRDAYPLFNIVRQKYNL